MSETENINIGVNVFGNQVGGGLGRAHTMAVATVNPDNDIVAWEEFEVGWDILHEQGPHGSLHGTITRFMRDHEIAAVVTGHMGAPMVNTMMKLGVLPLSAEGDARQAAQAAATRARNVANAPAPGLEGAPEDGGKWTLPVMGS